jgi:hypothetical protein
MEFRFTVTRRNDTVTGGASVGWRTGPGAVKDEVRAGLAHAAKLA